MYMARLNVTEARAQLPDVLDRVAAGEEITITRHGEAVAVVLRPDAVRARRGQETIERAREIGSLLAAAREQPLTREEISAERAEELVESVRAARNRS